MSNDLRNRLGGALLLAIGAAVAWFALWVPLEEARAGAPEVRWSLRVAVLVPLCLVFGLFLLAAGDRHPYRDVERRTLTPVGWGLMAAIAVSAFAVWWWMDSTMAGLGYR